MTTFLKQKAGNPSPSPEGTLKASPGARSNEIPKREPSWQYLHYLERRQKQLNQQVTIWTGIAIMSTIAACAISTISTWQ